MSPEWIELVEYCSTFNARALFAVLMLIGSTTGCSTGPTQIEQAYYLAVPSGDNVNYFRIRVHATTKFGETSFRTGWYPAAAVDSLYGDTGKSGITEAYRVQEELKDKYNAAILQTTSGYLTAAQDPKTDPAVLQSWLTAQRRVRAVASGETPLPPGAMEMEYNPGEGLTTAHADEKLVLVLASDPDAVIGAISAFSKDVQTSATVMRFADVLRQQTTNEVESMEARNEVQAKSNAMLVQAIDSLSAVLNDNSKSKQLVLEIEALRLMLENVR